MSDDQQLCLATSFILWTWVPNRNGKHIADYNVSGNYIEIDHGNGYITAYGHLSNRSVKVGDKVNRGQKIGEVGNTGRSTAPHLHYEVQYKNKAVDPSPFYFDIPVN